MRAAASLVVACAIAGTLAFAQWDSAGAMRTLSIRGHHQVLRMYGRPGGPPVIVSSGDGGWVHLAPHVAETLSRRGFFVIGFDVKAYLESFTHGSMTLRPEDEPGDYRTLIELAAREGGGRPLLIGVSAGAGLSVLAATDERNKAAIGGVIGLGLSDLTELGWRWQDDVVYLTHGAPREPELSVGAIADRVAPVPLAAIHSTHDEYAPLSEAQQVLARARPPNRLWIVDAADHRFSDNLAAFDRALLDAIAWTAGMRRGAAG